MKVGWNNTRLDREKRLESNVVHGVAWKESYKKKRIFPVELLNEKCIKIEEKKLVDQEYKK